MRVISKWRYFEIQLNLVYILLIAYNLNGPPSFTRCTVLFLYMIYTSYTSFVLVDLRANGCMSEKNIQSG